MNALGVTTITMDDEILKEIDEIRLQVGVSRSALIREVIMDAREEGGVVLRHGRQYKITTTISAADKKTIKQSGRSYAEAIRYFARKLRETDVEELEDEMNRLKVRLAELEAEYSKTKRRYEKVRSLLQKAIQEHEDGPTDPDMRRAIKFIRDRVEDWRKRGHDVTAITPNDEGRDFVDVASYMYGVPRGELLKELERMGLL